MASKPKKPLRLTIKNSRPASLNLSKMLNFYLKNLLFFLLISSSAFALSPEEKLPKQHLEQRAAELFLEVRCLVCNGQVIENSDTEFSYQMRKNIRQKIADGKSDDQIRDELVAEFGENILTRPSGINKFVLFGLPLAFAILVLILFRNRKPNLI